MDTRLIVGGVAAYALYRVMNGLPIIPDFGFGSIGASASNNGAAAGVTTPNPPNTYTPAIDIKKLMLNKMADMHISASELMPYDNWGFVYNEVRGQGAAPNFDDLPEVNAQARDYRYSLDEFLAIISARGLGRITDPRVGYARIGMVPGPPVRAIATRYERSYIQRG